jgi:hypothetical protein
MGAEPMRLGNLRAAQAKHVAESSARGTIQMSRGLMRVSLWYGLVGVLFGLLLIAASLYAPIEIKNPDPLTSTFISVVQTVGVTVFALGIFNLVIETKDWRDYFEQRIRQIVIEQSYLNQMDTQILNTLQTNVLKALFKDQNIDREGSFLNYFHTNLHKYIAAPYRQDVTCELLCELDKLAESSWLVSERVTYICRKTAASIQKTIEWWVDPQEFVRVDSVLIEIQYPFNHPNAGKTEPLIKEPNLQQKGLNKKYEISVSLEKYSQIDRLIVIITSKYAVNKERFQYWQMAHPTSNFDITITYPPGNGIQVQPLGINPAFVLSNQGPGYFKMKYDSWMLPESGIAWRILPPIQAGRGNTDAEQMAERGARVI